MTKMVKKILIIVIMVIVTIQITSPECFSRPTTSRDESKYSFSLEYEFFNFSHMIEMLETQYKDIKSLVNMTRNRGILVSDLCFNTGYLQNDRQYEILRSTKDLDVQLEAGILFLGNNTCAFLRTETILECSHLNRLYSLHLHSVHYTRIIYTRIIRLRSQKTKNILRMMQGSIFALDPRI